MTIERDILKKLELIKKDIDRLKRLEPVKNDVIPVKNHTSTKNYSSTKSHSPVKNESAVLLLFDATGSMKPLWKETQETIKEMVERITKVGNVKLKCVAYRDYCDGSRLFEYSKWYTDAKPLFDFIRRIECDGGGDTPEAVEDALELAYGEEETVTRVILIGDAPPHSLEKAGRQATNLGKSGRPVFAFRVGNDSDTRTAFSEIAELSGGRYADLGSYKDLLDMISITIVHDVGGSEEVEKYIKKYETSDDVKEYSKSLPSYSKK